MARGQYRGGHEVPGGRVAISGHGSRESVDTRWAGDRGTSPGDTARSLTDPWSTAWRNSAAIYADRVPDERSATESSCRWELLFCLLGGHGVTYELASSAAAVLAERGIFGQCERRGDRLQRYVQDL